MSIHTTHSHTGKHSTSKSVTMRKKKFILGNPTNCTSNYIKFFTTNDSMWCVCPEKKKKKSEQKNCPNSTRWGKGGKNKVTRWGGGREFISREINQREKKQHVGRIQDAQMALYISPNIS